MEATQAENEMHAAPSQDDREPPKDETDQILQEVMDAEDPEEAAEELLSYNQRRTLREQAKSMSHYLTTPTVKHVARQK